MAPLASRLSRLTSGRWLPAALLTGGLSTVGLCVALSSAGWGALGAPLPAASTVAAGAPSAVAALTPAALCVASAPTAAREPRWQRAHAQARLHPERAESWVALGQQWLAQAGTDVGYAWNAAACSEHALRLDPEQVAALSLLASVKLTAHEFAAARSLAERALARDGEHAGALAALSDAALELGDVASASAAAQRLMDVHPALPAYARASYLRWLHGQEAEALELARLTIDAAGDPHERGLRAWALVQAAQLFWHRGDVPGAEAGYRMALAVRAGYAPALLGLARAASSRELWSEAAAHASAALAAQPSVESAALLGDVLARAGDVEGAAASYDRAERLGRHDARSL